MIFDSGWMADLTETDALWHCFNHMNHQRVLWMMWGNFLFQSSIVIRCSIINHSYPFIMIFMKNQQRKSPPFAAASRLSPPPPPRRCTSTASPKHSWRWPPPGLRVWPWPGLGGNGVSKGERQGFPVKNMGQMDGNWELYYETWGKYE